MGRYINNIPLAVPAETVFNRINQYLESEGYEYTQYQNENVFKKGKGLMTGPTFIKVSIYETNTVVEAWMKYALFPGVYVGELGFDSFMGAPVIEKLKERVAFVENIIISYGNSNINNAPVGAPAEGWQPNVQSSGMPPQSTVAAPTIYANAGPQGIDPSTVSKKDFIKNYAPESVKKDIRNAAICCYICAVISALSAIFINPYGLIDTAILVAPAIGMHLGKSKACAITLLVFSIADCILSTVLSGVFSGWLWVVAAIIAVVAFRKIDKQYQYFISNNNNQPTNNSNNMQ